MNEDEKVLDRKVLRDMPEQPEFDPANPVWPESPK
jgi:hypothetical protein